MPMFTNILLACLATSAFAVEPSSIQWGPVTGSPTGSATAFWDPHHTGLHKSLPTGSHPGYPWPPKPTGTGRPCNKIQYDFPSGTNSNTSKADAVRNLYAQSWAQYSKYCFGKDDFLPVNNSCTNDLFGWGASIVDGIDTAIIMNLTDIVEQQLKWIAQVDFEYSPDLVAGFDAVIRYLGGLLSAHDLLTGGYVPAGTYDQTLVDAVLAQATKLGNKLKYEFNTPSGLPAYQLNFTTNEIINSTFLDPLNNETYYDENTAIAGTILIEFYRLSDLTGDQSFRQLADKAESYLVNPYPTPVYPGLVGSELGIETGNFLTFDFGWKAGIDSFLEYLIKSYVYNPTVGTAQMYKDVWLTAVQSTINHIALHPYEHPELTFLSQADVGGNLEYAMDDYACFAGGNFLLGAQYLGGHPEIYDLGVKVTDSCHHLYNNSVTGLGPLAWAWYNATNQAYDPSDNNNATLRAQADKWGYFLQSSEYESFPESIESIWYAYRITGDSRWQEYNWEIFEAIAGQNSNGNNNPDINDINQPGSFINYLPSFYWAEVLKYLYLSFTPPDIISLDEYVFNTESHPVKIQLGNCGSHH